MRGEQVRRILAVIEQIEFLPGWKLLYSLSLTDKDSWLQWYWSDRDHIHGGVFSCKGRKWRISGWMTDSEVVQTAFMAAQACMSHETREAFKFQGEPVMRPHFDVYELVALSKREAIDKR